MQKALATLVQLPSGEKVLALSEPQAWWKEHDGAGYMDPRLLAPDPDQPRKHMNAASLQELRDSVATCGVREPITVTPRELAPWVRLKPEHVHFPFVIVSGHRRTEAAVAVELLAVPIRVKCYEDESAHRTDGGVLNTGRSNLTELEWGFEFVRERKAGKTLSLVAQTHGINILTVQNRINLTKLHPSLYPLLEADPRGKKRTLPIYPASILGGVKAPTLEELNILARKYAEHVDVSEATGHESFDELDEDGLRFAMQKLLVAVIVRRGLNSVRAADFIREGTLKFKSFGANHANGSQRYEPARRKDILLNLAKEVSSSSIVDWKPEEFKRIFGLSSREQDDALLEQLQGAVEVLTGVIKVIGRIRDSKKPTSPEVVRIMADRNLAKT